MVMLPIVSLVGLIGLVGPVGAVDRFLTDKPQCKAIEVLCAGKQVLRKVQQVTMGLHKLSNMFKQTISQNLFAWCANERGNSTLAVSINCNIQTMIQNVNKI